MYDDVAGVEVNVQTGYGPHVFIDRPDHSAGAAVNPDDVVALEVFNLLGIRNTINHTWIQDVTGRRYAIPNYLTARRINLKFAIRF